MRAQYNLLRLEACQVSVKKRAWWFFRSKIIWLTNKICCSSNICHCRLPFKTSCHLKMTLSENARLRGFIYFHVYVQIRFFLFLTLPITASAHSAERCAPTTKRSNTATWPGAVEKMGNIMIEYSAKHKMLSPVLCEEWDKKQGRRELFCGMLRAAPTIKHQQLVAYSYGIRYWHDIECLRDMNPLWLLNLSQRAGKNV